MPVPGLGAFHYVFSTRDDLITEQERLAAWIDAGAADLEEILARGLEAYLRLLESDPTRELVLLDVAAHAVRHDPAAVERARERPGDLVERGGPLHRGELGGVAETRLRTRAIGGPLALDGLTLTWLTGRDGDAARRHIRFLARSFAALATPRPAPEASDAH